MNRRGLMNFLLTAFVLLIVVMVLALAQGGVDIETIDKVISTLNWSNFEQNISSAIQLAEHQVIGQSRSEPIQIILTIVDKTVNLMGYSIMAVAKLAAIVARDNPNIINWRVLWALILLSLIAPLIYPIFIMVVSIILIIKEWWQNRKEKKEKEKLRRLHGISSNESI